MLTAKSQKQIINYIVVTKDYLQDWNLTDINLSLNDTEALKVFPNNFSQQILFYNQTHINWHFCLTLILHLTNTDSPSNNWKNISTTETNCCWRVQFNFALKSTLGNYLLTQTLLQIIMAPFRVKYNRIYIVLIEIFRLTHYFPILIINFYWEFLLTQ